MARRLGFAAAAAGYLLAVLMLAWWGQGRYPGDVLIWDRVGDEIRAGASPYYASDHGWYYAPPLAVLLALVTWIPVWAQAAGLLAVNVGAIRYMAGSWTRVGWWLLFPIVEMELIGGQVNFLMGAVLLAAVRGRPVGAIAMAFAKLAPILAVDRRQWHQVVVAGAVLAALTLPVLELWPQYMASLVGTYGRNVAPGAQLMIPFAPRLLVAVALVALNRPWSRMAGAIVAIPALYWPTLLLFAGVPWPKVTLRWPARLREVVTTGS